MDDRLNWAHNQTHFIHRHYAFCHTEVLLGAAKDRRRSHSEVMRKLADTPHLQRMLYTAHSGLA